eukprot:SAG31_NODE_44762_length_261_cov_0.956790_1_plen_20_part_10
MAPVVFVQIVSLMMRSWNAR